MGSARYKQMSNCLHTHQTPAERQDNLAPSNPTSMPSVTTAVEHSLYRIGYWSRANFVANCLILFGATTVLLSIILMVVAKQKAGQVFFASPESLPLYSTTTGCLKVLAYCDAISQLFLNIIGLAVSGSSNYLQQLCTSPTLDDIKLELSRGRDVNFGSNMPSALFGRRRKVWLLGFWMLLVLTTGSVHACLDAVTGRHTHKIRATSLEFRYRMWVVIPPFAFPITFALYSPQILIIVENRHITFILKHTRNYNGILSNVGKT